jgi:hypothetical protein
MLFSLMNFWKIVRDRYLMKAAMLVYLIVELAIMVIDFNAERFTFFESRAMWLNIVHCIFSGSILFTYLALEPKNTGLEVAIIISEIIILAGLFGIVFKVHVYLTLFANSIAYVVFFSILSFLLAQERIMIDCHGDRAREVKYRSDFFDEI